MAKGSIVVSLRSRGLISLSINSFDLRNQAIRCGIEVIDIMISFVLSLLYMSWTAWFSLLINLIAVGVSMATSDGPSASLPFLTLDFVSTTSEAVAFFLPFVVVLFLPLLLLFQLVLARREQALSHMATLKSQAVCLCLAVCGDEAPPATQDGAELVRKQVFVMLDDLHRYLHHRRAYSQSFFLPVWTTPENSNPANETLYYTSREAGVLLRKVHRALRDLHGAVQLLRRAGASEPHVDMLVQQVTRLHGSAEQLSAVKEMRSPVMLRAVIRWLSAIIFPIYMGFYCRSLHMDTSGATLFVLSTFVQIALMAVVDCAVSLEDPFDDTTLDTLSLLETMDQLAAMVADDDQSDSGLSGQRGGHTTTSVYAGGGGGGDGGEGGGGGETNGQAGAAGGAGSGFQRQAAAAALQDGAAASEPPGASTSGLGQGSLAAGGTARGSASPPAHTELTVASSVPSTQSLGTGGAAGRPAPALPYSSKKQNLTLPMPPMVGL